MKRVPILAGALAVAIALAGAAEAAAITTVSRSGDVIAVTGGDEVNTVRLYRNDDSSVGDDAGIAAGPGCSLVPDRQVARCDTDRPVQRIALSLGGGDDRIISLESTENTTPRIAAPPLTADLGAGDDQALGSRADDTLNGGPGRDDLRGGGGADTIDGGPGADELIGDSVDKFDVNADLWPFGDDRLIARDGEGDRIRCGLGTDTVVADAFDSSEAMEECERRDGLEKLTVRIGAVRPVRLAAFLSGAALRVSLTCSRTCTGRVFLLVPKADALRLGLTSLPIAAPIAYRDVRGTGPMTVTLKLRRVFRSRLLRVQRLAALIDVSASDETGISAKHPIRRLVLRR